MKMIKKKLLLLAAAGCLLISGCRSPQASAEVRSTAAKETMRQQMTREGKRWRTWKAWN